MAARTEQNRLALALGSFRRRRCLAAALVVTRFAVTVKELP